MPSTLLLGEERSAPQKFTSAKKEQVRSICLWQYVPVRISLDGEEALEVPRACASAPVPTRRLALSVGGASQSHMFQISLLLTGACVVNLDMPSLCGWSENKAASHLSTGNGRCAGVHCV